MIVTTDMTEREQLRAAADAHDAVWDSARFLKKAIGVDRTIAVARLAHEKAMVSLERSMWRVRQQAAACGQHMTMEGLGQHVARVPIGLATELRRRFGQDCLQHPEFLADVLREFPGCKVPYKARKTMVQLSQTRHLRTRSSDQPLVIAA